MMYYCIKQLVQQYMKGGVQLKWKYDDDRPIYTQIIGQIERGIARGVYPPGSDIPSVRALALEAEVNPNTMQRALAELEAKGLLRTQRTAGRSVTEDRTMIDKLKEKIAADYIRAFLSGMDSLGIGAREAATMLKNAVGASGGEADGEVK
jgi:DNA-binding transcriptional regulator YhcF (GntR family)